MMRDLTTSLFFVFFLAASAIASDSQDQDGGSHGHAHGPDGGHIEKTVTPEDAEQMEDREEITIAVTQWTDKMELFMEYPACVVNVPSRFIIHLTVLEGFLPVLDGEVELRFTDAGGQVRRVVEKELLREGIFTPTVTLPNPGKHDFELVYRNSEMSDAFLIADFTVASSYRELQPENEVESGDEIVFLKEQQWKIPFSTTDAEVREIKSSVWAIGEVLPSPASYAEIVTPVDGVIQTDDMSTLALPGSSVHQGEVVAMITPPLEGNSWANSKLALSQAKRNYDRASRLIEAQAISEREFEEARDEYMIRRAGHEKLQGSGEGDVLNLVSPIDGKVIDWRIRPGQRLHAGELLMAIADPSLVWLKVNVYEGDYKKLGTPVGVHLSSDDGNSGWDISGNDMRVLSSGATLDPKTRTVPILLEINNSEGIFYINESVPVELYSTKGSNAVAVPRSSIYEDEGLEIVFVQAGGESFEKRIVSTGPSYSDWVSILKGIEPGERVVTQGGYHVKLASTSAEIGHGHAH
jgi:RND family efflux transporter MFP subunit